MTREWQQTRFKEYVMPDAVYYQSLWAVRDLERMEKRLKELLEENCINSKSSSIVMEGNRDYNRQKPTENKALERAILEQRIMGIKRALSIVPEDYRSYVMCNIILKNPGQSFPNKLWRIWKQRFLFNVAKNLTLI